MHWAVWIWVVLMLVLDVVGFVQDLMTKRAWPRTWVSFASGTLCPAFVLYYYGLIDLPLPKLLVVLAAGGTACEAGWTHQEDRCEPGYSRNVAFSALTIMALFYAPALILGWIGPD
ncbi:MAG: hypothetical protein IPK67_18825 [Planctomycetes bacterium]|nr:hypothetical protein [Planctomycetota bacterium]